MEIKKLPFFEFESRIAYAETDRMGVLYYGNYFALFERGRTELMRNLGVRYRDLEEKEKVFLPVSEASCRYFAPVYYDDQIVIRTKIRKIGGASIEFSYEVSPSGSQKKVAEGFTRHPFVDKNFHPIRIPKNIRNKLLSPT